MGCYWLRYGVIAAMKVALTQGQFATIDDDAFEAISRYRWYAVKARNTFYARASVCRDGKQRHISMHRFILGLTDPAISCDHIDMNGLNNVRSNLRACNSAENARNQANRKNNSSGYKGVHFHKPRGAWVARIGVDNKRLHLGYYPSPEMAGEAYKRAALELHGEFSNTRKRGCQ